MNPQMVTVDRTLTRGRVDADVADSDESGADWTASIRLERRLRAPGLELVFMVLFAVAGWWVGIRRLSDNSFFVHLRTGREILNGGLPHHDIYSYTAPGVHWIAQSWLAELAYG